MFSNLSLTDNDSPVAYPISDSKLPFSDYINLSRKIVEERRLDLSQEPNRANKIVEANTPYELYPTQSPQTNRIKYGTLLIHGLLDSPFSLKDLGRRLQSNGILSRAVLLPGHGTRPSDLVNISYHQWIQAVRYGIESLRKEVDHIFLIGYSTGAALSLYEALQDSSIEGVVLLSPAIRIKAPVDMAFAWYRFLRLFGTENNDWMYRADEIDYVKYRSIALNAIRQVAQLTRAIHELRTQSPMTAPIFMVMSREDETVSSHSAINFFSSQHNADSRLLLYSSVDHRYPDPRINVQLVKNVNPNIAHYSHICIPFAPNNSHYGEQGDYVRASQPKNNKFIYGAYNRVEEKLFNTLHTLHLTRPRRELTFNPTFDNMANEIVKFILASHSLATSKTPT